MRRLRRIEPDEEIAESEIERICLTRVEIQRSGDRLERCAVTEVESRQQRSPIAEERDDRERGSDQPLLREPGSGGAERGASFVSIGKLAASHSGTPPLRTLILIPFRSSSAATRVLTSSFGSESYATTSPPLGNATESMA